MIDETRVCLFVIVLLLVLCSFFFLFDFPASTRSCEIRFYRRKAFAAFVEVDIGFVSVVRC